MILKRTDKEFSGAAYVRGNEESASMLFALVSAAGICYRD